MIFERIKLIASQNPYGFTVKLPGLEPVTTGYIVAYQATQNSHDDAGLQACITHALENNQVLGGWQDTQTGVWYWDSCRVFLDRNEAISWGQTQQQLAIFDLDTLTEIRL